VTNVEQVFDALGESPEAAKCVGFEGLKSEHDSSLRKPPLS
jgi:ferritin-like metal-binding protein YciE